MVCQERPTRSGGEMPRKGEQRKRVEETRPRGAKGGRILSERMIRRGKFFAREGSGKTIGKGFK